MPTTILHHLPGPSTDVADDNQNLSHHPCWRMYDATTILMPRAAFEQAGVATVTALMVHVDFGAVVAVAVDYDAVSWLQ